MKTTRWICLAALVSFCSAIYAANDQPADLTAMNERALLARARLLTQEELEISRRAVKQASSEKVRAFAGRAAARSAAFDKKLDEIGKAAGIDPQPGSKALFERLEAIEKLKGEAFDPDYLKIVLDFHHDHIRVYEQLGKIAGNDVLRNFAREALVEERAHLKAAQEIAAPIIPHVKDTE